MPITFDPDDLFIIQEKNTAVPKSVVFSALKNGIAPTATTAKNLGLVKGGSNVKVDDNGELSVDLRSLVYKGTIDLTKDVTDPGVNPGNTLTTNDVGNLYINTAAGKSHASWETPPGKGILDQTDVVVGEMVIWDGTQWDIVGKTADNPGVTSVDIKIGGASITSNNNQTDPVFTLPMASSSDPGLITGAQFTKFNNAQPGTVTSVTAGTGLTGGTITGNGTINLSPTNAGGTYTNANITVDAQGRITAASNGAAGGGGAGTITDVTAGNGLRIKPSGSATAPEVEGINASTSAKGVVQLANVGVLDRNADPRAVGSDVTHAATPKSIQDNYMPLDIAKLAPLTP